MKTVTCLFCLFALALASGCTSIRSLDQDEIPTYTLNDIRAEPGLLSGALLDGGPGAILAVTKGEILPFDIMARLPFATLVTGGNWIRFDQNVWFYFAEDDMLISPDGKRFGPIYNMRTLKELFNFESGEVALGFGVTGNGEAKAALTLLPKAK